MADSVRRRTRGTPRRGPALRARRCDERGSGGVEFLIVVVSVFFLFAVLLQYGIRMHADRLAQVAAHEGAVAAARFDGTTATGRSTAARYADRARDPRRQHLRFTHSHRGTGQRHRPDHHDPAATRRPDHLHGHARRSRRYVP